MRVLILTCNTGGGHNAVAAALRDSFQHHGASCDVMDGLGFISKKASKFVSKWHTRFYRRYPRLYKAGYMSAEGDKEMDRRDGPVYRYIARGARRLGRTLQSGGYDAVVGNGTDAGMTYGNTALGALNGALNAGLRIVGSAAAIYNLATGNAKNALPSLFDFEKNETVFPK